MNNRIVNNPALQYASTRSLNDSRGVADNSNASATSAAKDRLSLSNQAGQLQNLMARAQAAPELNQARVESIRQAIEQGQYAVDADRLAASMLGSELQLTHTKGTGREG